MGTIDRGIRLLIAVVIAAVLFLSNIISGALSIVLIIVAAVFTLTSLIGLCPLYRLLGISTKKKSMG